MGKIFASLTKTLQNYNKYFIFANFSTKKIIKSEAVC